MSIEDILKSNREHILRIAARHGARNLRIFGSVVRDEAGPNSDVDFLVDMDPGCSLMDMGGLLMDLQDLLGRKVDIVEPEGLYWVIRDRALKEAIPL